MPTPAVASSTLCERIAKCQANTAETCGIVWSISSSSSFSRFFSPTIAVMVSISRRLSLIFFSNSCDFSYLSVALKASHPKNLLFRVQIHDKLHDIALFALINELFFGRFGSDRVAGIADLLQIHINVLDELLLLLKGRSCEFDQLVQLGDVAFELEWRERKAQTEFICLLRRL